MGDSPNEWRNKSLCRELTGHRLNVGCGLGQAKDPSEGPGVGVG